MQWRVRGSASTRSQRKLDRERWTRQAPVKGKPAPPIEPAAPAAEPPPAPPAAP